MEFISQLIPIEGWLSFVLLPCFGTSSLTFSSSGLTESRIKYL